MVSRRRFLKGLGLAPLALRGAQVDAAPTRSFGPRIDDPSRLLYMRNRPLDTSGYGPTVIDPGPVREWARATVPSYVSTLHAAGEPRLGIVRFNWFEVKKGRQTGQLPGPWIPHDGALQPGARTKIPPGMLAWSGSVSYHERHLRSLIRHGFDLLVFQIPFGWRRTQLNHLRALRNLRREGPIPTLAPIFEAASYRDYSAPKDFSRQIYRDALFEIISRYFDMHFTYLGPEDLTWKDNRVLIYLWWIPGARAAPCCMLDELNARLYERYGFEAYWSAHEYWSHIRPDTVDRLFNGVQSFRRDVSGNLSIMPGFFPPNEHSVREGHFLARRGAATYWEAWDQVINEVKQRRQAPAEVIVETDNEVGEGTAITSLIEANRVFSVEGRNEAACTRNACRVPGAEGLEDMLSANPLEYLQISKARKEELLGVVRSL